MFHIVYETVNNTNGKIYVGKHKTSDLMDDYLGSGKLLKRAIDKYGKENFTRKILGVYNNEAEMNDHEARIVNEDFLSRPDVYNLKLGGEGGWDHIDNASLNKKPGYEKGLNNFSSRSKASKTRWQNENYREIMSSVKSFKGKKHTEETKRRIGEANSEHQSGAKNSQYGSIWITNGVNSKKINKKDSIPDGWNRGRKMDLNDTRSYTN